MLVLSLLSAFHQAQQNSLADEGQMYTSLSSFLFAHFLSQKLKALCQELAGL
jgi:hypothetical protein